MRHFASALLIAAISTIAAAQTVTSVPRLVRFAGTLPSSRAVSMESVTLAVYRDQSGGSPLWQEIQNVSVDSEGHYSLLMGSTLNDGMPIDLFTSGEPRWLAIQLNQTGESEQPRVLMVSVPYALKASDADTLGGKPASAYMLATPPSSATTSASATSTSAVSTNAVKPRINSGSPNFIGKFTNSTDLINSSMFETGGNVGISTTTPLISLDVRTGALPQMGIAGATDYLTFFASDVFGPAIYWDPAKDMRFGRGGASLYNPFGFVEQMRIKSSNGNVGIGTQTPATKLDVAGDISLTGNIYKPVSSGLSTLIREDNARGNLGIGIDALFTNGGGSNTAVGDVAMASVIIPAVFNSALGEFAMTNTTTGSYNTAIGTDAMKENTTGGFNTAVGAVSLLGNATGVSNTAIGYAALFTNTTGNDNTAVGAGAMSEAAAGQASFNTAMGSGALSSNLTDSNSAFGYKSLTKNSTGGSNAAFGAMSMANNVDGDSNSAFGNMALTANISGTRNTAAGFRALASNTSGTSNVAIGANALPLGTGSFNVAIGPDAMPAITSGANNIAIGSNAAGLVSGAGSFNIHIGSIGNTGDNAVTRIGINGNQTRFFAAGIRGATTANNDALPVMIDSNGQLGTVNSSRRFKEDIADMGDSSRGLMELRPVTFRYKQRYDDGSKPIQYGLIAEEVAEVYPDLVAHSADGQIESVKYQVLDSMLLNEIQRQQAQIRRLEERLAKLEAANVGQALPPAH